MVRINGIRIERRDEIGEVKSRYLGGSTRDIVTAACNKYLIEHGLPATEIGFNRMQVKPKKNERQERALQRRH